MSVKNYTGELYTAESYAIFTQALDNAQKVYDDKYAKLDKSSVPKGLGGIGSRNVNDRIHLYFSDDYGMTVSSAPGKGTLCRIRIPSINTKIVNAKEGETYVPGTDRR